ncbi:unnamed protein product [Urochloa decumbens]|uniref:F-box domain-containing protein n=1 Tax=Urochloa decumbens TaxID=240449 RepID=A0ABC9B974_9POAL
MHSLDGMAAPTPEADRSAAADRLSALPDGVLHHVLGFLQADEAVRTSVLSPRWRDLWRSMPVLRVTRRRVLVQSLRRFLDHLLLLRDSASRLDAFLLDCVRHLDDDVVDVNLWLRHALLCHARALVVSVVCSNLLDRVPLRPLVSEHLTVLDLHGPSLQGKCLDFSRCPELKDLKLSNCNIDGEVLYSMSLERLCIDQCSFSSDRRTRISAPGLVWLKLTSNGGRTPVLEDMPLLVTAEVFIDGKSADTCHNDDPGYCGNGSCVNCYGIDDGSAGCVLLQGLAAATELKLMSVPEAFILKRDLRFCPTFSKLKTLLLNGWCVATDDHALICILQHSLDLENLTLEFLKAGQPRNTFIPSKAIYNSVEQLYALENLRRIDVTCHQVDERVNNFLKCMATHGIPLEEISIQQKNIFSEFGKPIAKIVLKLSVSSAPVTARPVYENIYSADG